MDAYNIHQEIFKHWQQLSHKADAGSIKKTWSEVPVYVKIDGKLQVVDTVSVEDGKIVLDIK